MPIGRIGQEIIVNSTATGSQGDSSITALADGRFVATWRSLDGGDGDGSCIRARLYNGDGSAAGDDFIVNSTVANDQNLPSITALADGRFVATWESYDTIDDQGSCIRARIYNADGSPAGDDFIVNSTPEGYQFSPSITALADGRFAVTWESFDSGDGSGNCIRARIYNADGSATGDDFVVNSTPDEGQFDPSITALADGRFVVTWTSFDPGDGSGSCVRGRVHNADGSAAGNDFVVNSTAAGNQLDTSITALADGRFVATWQSADTGDGSGNCIRARIYNANGSASGGDFIVNSTAADNQFYPSITALADGRFVATWTSGDSGDGSGSCIRARLYNVDGSAAGDDFIVNSTATNEQSGSSVTALADGRFVVTWTSFEAGDGSGTCIRSQIFDPTVFIGTVGEDTWQGGNFADRIYGGASADTLSGLGGDDLINGDAGNDILNGSAGNDKLFGGEGNDTLDGGTGNDTMAGGGGNDIYIVSAVGDQTIEAAGQGTDTVRSYINWTLAANVERLELKGAGNLNGTGNALANTLVGNSGNNLLSGGAGNDYMVGGAGNDIFIVGAVGDSTIENVGGGTDTVRSYINWTLANNVERLELQGSSNLNGTGNSLNNTLVGNSGANSLNGGDGNDYIVGGAGNDTLTGGAGNDRLIGGTGSDILNGGTGNDTFDFDLASDSPAGPALRDSIVGGFSHGSDLIDLATIDANTLLAGNQAFSFIGSAAFSGVAGQLRYTNYNGTVIIDADVNGDSTADMQILVAGTNFMTGTDFIL
ncbi:calcium-binding protein [Allomesorhizobium camelthorni]|uniref:Calcium-binding protein n=1 Tax=Allomesorhizobium camelthorni TaxID=475069 RepID=A0A6G4W7N5_9HYPH|nr:calcium-binding protein [Mesorhizobium camelthorni]NGO50253.1 calcium-binding protein [Mesorhizobium camelthorni]